MIVPYNPSDSAAFYEEYYSRQDGSGMSVYSGQRILDGAGIGSFFGGLAKRLGKTALSAVKNIGEDFINGGDLKSSAVRGLKSFGSDALGDVFQSVSGGGNKANGRKRKPPKGKAGGKRKRQRGGSIFD